MIKPGSTVCAYVPFGSEPGSLEMVEALRAAGAHVLLPVVPRVMGPLEWAAYGDARSLRNSRLRGLREPTGTRLPPTVLRRADLILVPALAVDQTGTRLGRGAGYYDRTLPHAASTTALVAVVRDDELVFRLPADAHGVPMNGVLTPRAGLTLLSARNRHSTTSVPNS
jgi:5-formyltetrahydrofolate cyclo-ligase